MNKQVKRGFTNYLPRGLNFLKKKNLEKIPKNSKNEFFLKISDFFSKSWKTSKICKQNLQVKFASKNCKQKLANKIWIQNQGNNEASMNQNP